MTTRRRLLGMMAAGAAGLWTRPGRLEAGSPAPRPLRILVLGGTGFIGPHQVRYALARGHQLTLFNRGRRPQAWPARVEELVGDRNTGDLSALAGREWDVCIDNPTTLPFWVRDAGQALKGRVRHYVFVSTVSAYASDARPGQDEGAPLAEYRGEDALKETQETLRADLEGLYGALKARSEREAEAWFPGQVTVVRPALIVGPGDETDRFTYWPVRLKRGGEYLAPGDGRDPVQLIDARDQAEWMVRLAEQRQLGVFNALGPRRELSLRGLLEDVRAGTGARATPVWASAAFLEQHQVAAWSALPVWIPAAGDTLGSHRRSNARAVAAGLTFRPLRETARDTLAWFESQPAERRARLRAGLSAEREAQLLAAWKASRWS